MVSLTIGSVLLIAILIKYIYTRHRLVSWNARYLFSRRSRESGGDINVLEQGDGRQSIYDRWLVLRFSIGFVVLATFQLITILSEIAQLRTHTKEELGESANLSAEKAKTDFLHFLAGVSTSLLVGLSIVCPEARLSSSCHPRINSPACIRPAWICY